MNTELSLKRDERTVAVENASYRWPCAFVSFALLIDMIYRALFRHEAAFDLMALVIVSGFIVGVYQARQKALPRRWVKVGLLVALLAAVISLAVVLLYFGLR